MTLRLDAALAARGLARSRTHAADLISQGLVTVDGRGAVRSSTRVDEQALLAIAETDHYVSRAAHKLIAALDAFDVDVDGRLALDIGASTGGFTQVLRERGADPVIALDVGHGQLAESVRADPGVVVVEGFNARDLTPEALRAAGGVTIAPTVVTADLSFISLSCLVAQIRAVAASGADIILLIKPQFEVGRAVAKGGVVTDPGMRNDAVCSVLWSAWDVGLGTRGIIASPILGRHGNAEFVAHFGVDRGTNPTEWLDTVDRLATQR